MKSPLPLLLVVLGLTTADGRAADWSHWRGPEQNGVARDRDLPERFDPDPKAKDSNLLWRADYGGRTTPIIQGGQVYFLNYTGDKDSNRQERVVCLNADTGAKVWEYKFNVFYTGIVTDRL